MELDVTHMVESADDMPPLSASVAELGNNAATITWNNAKAYGGKYPLLKSDNERNAARDHFAGYGAWSRDEIAAWSETELQGIACQEVAAAIREAGDTLTDPAEYQRLCDSGTLSGRLFQGDDGKWYFYFGD